MSFQEQASIIIEWVDADKLKAHPKNTEIYGEDGYQDLVESIKELGVLQAIYVRPDNTVISGHRRWLAAKEAGKQLPVIRVNYPTPMDEIQAIIEHNRYRIKNGLQLYNEGKELEKIEAEKARGRMASSHSEQGVVNFPHLEGKTRDKVAETIGLGSGRQWDKLNFIADHKPEMLKEIKPDGITIHKAVTTINREERLGKKREEQRFPTGKYDIIYADPPWHYKNDGFSGGADAQYPTMTIEQLNDLPVNILAESDCVLFLWATNPLLKDAINLIEVWGFNYKTNFAWDKETPRIGFYNMAQHELLLIATKGTNLEPWGEKFPSVFHSKRTTHSEKPHSVYEMIEKMYPNCRMVELFARRTREGWTSWGNEIS